TFDSGVLALGEPETERVNWSKDGVSLAPAPEPGATVSAHWDWVCATLTNEQTTALTTATQVTLDLVNAARSERVGGGL
ncbi:MAG: hypothetical protein QOF47_2472, partial [Mycobacterium sp.]|nr:hypothetical protein [Mycobacterium sp.]